MLGEIAIALVVIVVLVAIGFGGYLVYYHLSARRRGHVPQSVIPSHITNVFSRNRPTSSGGGGFADGAFGSRGGPGSGGGGVGGRSRQKFSALDVDEAWDSHVDEEMVDYDNVRMTDRSTSGVGGGAKTAYYDELDDVDDSTHLAASSSAGGRSGSGHKSASGIDAKGRMSTDELNERYDSVMETGSSLPASSNPFGSGAYRSDADRR